MSQNAVTTAINTIKEQFNFQERFGNFINGEWREPVKGDYFTDTTPISGDPVAKFARSDAEDIEQALDAAHAAKTDWARTAPAARAAILNKIADRLEGHLQDLALAETLDNGKPIRESVGADLPLTIDQFRYFAGAIRVQEGTIAEIDGDTVAYHFREPLGVIGQIIGGEKAKISGFENGYYIQPTVFAGDNSLRIFQEEIFGPVVGVTKFRTVDEAIAIANDTPYGLAAGVWTRNNNLAYRAAREIQAGRVWVNAYHLYPAHSTFGGYKQSGLGRENHRLALEHYQQVKAVVTSYSEKALGLF
jgi:acyl-CoA reductase-like NAD-dependent aldehyde dehydrogenase